MCCSPSYIDCFIYVLCTVGMQNIMNFERPWPWRLPMPRFPISCSRMHYRSCCPSFGYACICGRRICGLSLRWLRRRSTPMADGNTSAICTIFTINARRSITASTGSAIGCSEPIDGTSLLLENERRRPTRESRKMKKGYDLMIQCTATKRVTTCSIDRQIVRLWPSQTFLPSMPLPRRHSEESSWTIPGASASTTTRDSELESFRSETDNTHPNFCTPPSHRQERGMHCEDKTGSASCVRRAVQMFCRSIPAGVDVGERLAASRSSSRGHAPESHPRSSTNETGPPLGKKVADSGHKKRRTSAWARRELVFRAKSIDRHSTKDKVRRLRSVGLPSMLGNRRNRWRTFAQHIHRTPGCSAFLRGKPKRKAPRLLDMFGTTKA